MAELNVNEKQLTASQLGCVLNDIAQTATQYELRRKVMPQVVPP